ncbi:MAG: PQQ-binding-like beta-propeller repeat protein [Phycisphaerae bacterium]
MSKFLLRICLASLLIAMSAVGILRAEEPPKITHDWPSYTGPDGTFADLSRVPLLDDLSRAKLLWVSEHEDLGYGKTSSRGGHVYGSKSHFSGSCDLIVAGGLVIAGYFTPKGDLEADDVLLAVDAATGKTRWKQVFAGKGYVRPTGKHTQYGPAPTAAGGKVFHLGSGGRIYCVEVSSGKSLWETALGDYVEYYKGRAAKMSAKDAVLDDDSRGFGRPTFTPLAVIGGVLIVPADRLYAYDTVTGKELWRLDGATRTPSPVSIGGTEYAACSGDDENLRLVEPKTGKVLWTEKVGFIMTRPAFVVAGDRAFIPVSKAKNSAPVVLAAYALGETAAKLLWESKETMGGADDSIFAYRDGVVYANIPQATQGDVRIMAMKGDDGTVLNDFKTAKTISLWGQFHLWGDRLVLIGDHCHESIGHACYYQSLMIGPKEWKITGHPITFRNIRQYAGVCAYDSIWMRPAFADGLVFTRSINKLTGRGAILCWDVRARPSSTWLKFGLVEPIQGVSKEANHAGVEAEVEDGKIARVFTMLPFRGQSTENLAPLFASGTPREITAPIAGRWQGNVNMELERDTETWQFDLDTTGATPSGTYQRIIPALAQPTAVEGVADAKEETLANNTKRWVINFKQAVCPESDSPIAKRRDMYIVVTRSATGEQEAFARARSLNTTTHEVQVGSFEAGEKTLTLKGAVLFHSDKYMNPSDQRPGTVALDVDVTLTGDGKNWKGTYKGQYGAAWTGSGTVSKQR